jgi:molybdate transport system substrate-binding protein
MRRKVSSLICAFAVLACACADSRPPSADKSTTASRRLIRVAAASDLQFVLGDINQEFQKHHHDIAVEPSFGSSGNFFAQISNGAPFDVYFSADINYPRQLVDGKLARADTLVVYAVGRIVVWVPSSSPIPVQELGIKSLVHSSVRKVAIANPEHAPYGRAAVAAMKSLGIYELVQKNLVFGENISQTAQFVHSGSADIRIIALSLAVAPALKDQGRYWEVPTGAYPRLEQGAVVLASSPDPEAARSYRDFVLGPSGRALLNRSGFSTSEQ